MKTASRNIILLLSFCLLFALPGVLAYFFYKNPQYLSGVRTNKGILLEKPILIPELKNRDKKWNLVLWQPGACGQDCARKLEELARVRLALGRYLYHIRTILMMNQPVKSLSVNLKKEMKENQLDFLITGSKDAPVNSAHIYIANPEGYLVLSYQMQDNPKNIYQDLKRLVAKNG